MTLARDLGNGPRRAFGSALPRRHSDDPLRTPALSTVRAIRPRAINKGRCLVCGDRFFGCGHDPEDSE